MLGLFLNTLTAEYMYSRRNMLNFQKQLQNAVISETKDFSPFFIAFLKCKSSLEHFGKKDGPPNLSIQDIIDSKGSDYLNV